MICKLSLLHAILILLYLLIIELIQYSLNYEVLYILFIFGNKL